MFVKRVCLSVSELTSNHQSIICPCMIHRLIGLSCILCNVTFPTTFDLIFGYFWPKNYNMLILTSKFANRLRDHYRQYSLLRWWALFSFLSLLSYLSWMYVKIDGCESSLLLPQQSNVVRSFGMGTWPHNGAEAERGGKWKLLIIIADW